jgi:putative transposase
MNDYRHGSHTVFSIHLHVVWITQYRHKVLRGAVAERVREVVREECRRQRVDILQGHISADHVHVLLSIPPQVTISRLIQQLKGKSAYLWLREFATIRQRYWGRHVWARGYFCRSSGNVTDEVIKEYDNDSFILGPQGCGSHASSEKRSFFWYRSLLFPTNPMGAILTAVAIP